MKVILYMTISLNGIIARENNEEDFLSDYNWFTFVELAHKAGCTIWGRKTYDVVTETYSKQLLDTIKEVKKLIVSADKDFKPNEGFESVKSPKDALEKAEELGFKEVILSGGSGLNSSFVKENLIDEIIVNIEPVIIGKGIPLFSPSDFDLKLSEPEVEMKQHGIIQLRYKVRKN